MASHIDTTVLQRNFVQFLTWWLRELASLVPERLRMWYRNAGNIVAVTISETAITLFRSVPDALEELGRVDRAAPTDRIRQEFQRIAGKEPLIFLCLPEDWCLVKTLSLPLAVEENLRQTIEFEIDRYTPFKPDQVHFAYRITGRDASAARLSIELEVVPRKVVDEQIGKLAQFGLPVQGAVLARALIRDGDACPNFLPAAARRRELKARFWIRLSLLSMVGVLFAAAIVVPIWQKRAAAIALLAPMARAKADAEATDAMRGRLEGLVAEHNFILEKRWNTPSMVMLLEEVSKLLPDDTYISQFEYNGKELQIQGETAAASKLIELIAQSPYLADQAFKAPVTKIQGTSSERFHIVAALRTAPPPKHQIEGFEKAQAVAPAAAVVATPVSPPKEKSP